MATSNIKALIPSELRQVWDFVLDIENYAAWRSDLCKTEVISDKQFIEYTKDGYPTTFTVTLIEPYRRWEFDMENSNMKGHWIGIFTAKADETETVSYTHLHYHRSGEGVCAACQGDERRSDRDFCDKSEPHQCHGYGKRLRRG